MVSKIKFLLIISSGEKSRVPFGIDGFCIDIFIEFPVLSFKFKCSFVLSIYYPANLLFNSLEFHKLAIIH
jgi:hypothetical protein